MELVLGEWGLALVEDWALAEEEELGAEEEDLVGGEDLAGEGFSVPEDTLIKILRKKKSY